ncbi:54S ribosomal protein yml6, mitochondrial [Acrodontium crateriforme]|uniref:Large ribosomal subunit protein uL4m n=1 Tax=Acrodontium crateriforme TaxID=150365 RepID=A0AAQ3M1B7_9PEZI|nr:54S ribosomal protein yml6, mitochondrial [Acrodontium crateriforme]
MASKRIAVPSKQLFGCLKASQQLPQRCLVRSMATETSQPNATLSQTYADAHIDSMSAAPVLQRNQTQAARSNQETRPINPFRRNANCTLVAFPSLEPQSFVQYPDTHLMLPLRKDLLHRAVIYEGDMTRSGTASTKWRSEVHGSNRKIRPQKGSGKARLGDKKSPMLRGGGVAFGPKPRDFSTELPRKIYDLAWRTALSYRFIRGELIVTDGIAEIDVHKHSAERYMSDMLNHNRMGHANGRSLFITQERRETLFTALEKDSSHARAKEVYDVDVKNLLELGHIIVEREALEEMFREHQSDLAPAQRLVGTRQGIIGVRGEIQSDIAQL